MHHPLLLFLQVPLTTRKEGVYVATRLRSGAVKDILDNYLIQPVIDNNWKVHAFRMHWPKMTEEEEAMTWQQIISIREGLDSIVRELPCLLHFVSGIGGVNRKNPVTGVFYTHPIISYWVVISADVLNTREMLASMNANPYGAQARLNLQPFSTGKKDLVNALHVAVKDNMEGCVRRIVDENNPYPTEGNRGNSLVKFVTKGKAINEHLYASIDRLRAARFMVEFIEI